MYWSSNGYSGYSTVPYLRNKTAQARLLEHLRLEKPTLNVFDCPTSPVVSGRNRLKFPDPNNDCYVELELLGQTSRVSLPVCYDSEKREDFELDEGAMGGVHGLWYSLQVVSVVRFSLDGVELPQDQTQDSFFCCCPLSDQRKICLELSKDVYGFWFRFFGEKMRFRIKVGLKLEGTELLSRDLWKDDPYFAEVCQGGYVSSVEFDIYTRSREIEQDTNPKRLKLKAGILSKNQSQPYLYSNDNYCKFIRAVNEMKKEARYSELDTLLSHAIGRYHADTDLKVVVLLEQGLQACRKRYCDYAKELYKNAADLLSKCRNKSLLTGRTYVYLSEVHFNEGCIGNAGESLDIARKNLEGVGPCEDYGDLCFYEGLVLMVHAKRNQVFLNNLIPEAREKFLEAVKIYRDISSVDGMEDKLYLTYIKLASLELQPLPSSNSTELSVLPNQLAMAQKYLDLVKEHIEVFSRKTMLYYYHCCAELALETKSMDTAREYLSKAEDIAIRDHMENEVHVDIALEEIRRCLKQEFASVGSPVVVIKDEDKPPMEEKELCDLLDGYYGDESN
ncbi:predicted protein [Nematostella vectensis]|uniref:Uncharacterized protein n=1 Tax=Nematostella vectensis TaxID=45351 RepID=A7RN52_NEMVE|nr:uncharacterized protein LOC5519223 [Nematostella vectensis]EDO47008.1 predicted protein [Nematostella vectensis]|eukprot:XP_001639071.1 predicted protein [Nematostella vectensis]